MQRRKFFRNTAIALGSTALAGLGYKFSIKKSGNYAPYFERLNKALKQHKRAVPSLVLDLDILDKNLLALQKLLPNKEQFRIVVKSLPSLELINYVMQKIGTTRLMSFHQPFLSQISTVGGTNLDILLGKPMPVQTAAYYYDTLKTENGFDPAKQVQWLVDTESRIKEYIDLAKTKNLQLRLNVEIDVGLHRGGFTNTADLEKALSIIQQNKDHVTFSGFMGYDPHIVKVPSILLSRETAYNRARDFYNKCKALVKTKFPELWHDHLTFNGAGSPTIVLHKENDTPLNDLSAGSFAVKPTDFDIDTLEMFEPASFIASPVLKKLPGTTLPSVENFGGLMQFLNPNKAQSFYIYGGSWMAKPHQPEGIEYNSLFGISTNQVMMNASADTDLDINDFVFFRPTQSEFVFLQFGNLLCVRKGEIVGEWAVFKNDFI